MSTHDAVPASGGPTSMTRPFPEPGRQIQHAYRELMIAATGTKEQVKALGDPRLLARPWDPPTCVRPGLRRELWDWLEHVVTWLNTEYVWDVPEIIPACWPHHPHLAHEIAVLADQRRQAGTALTSDRLEEWHRYCLPAFVERMRSRLKAHCEEGHQPCPAKGRHARHLSNDLTTDREDTYDADMATLKPARQPGPGPLPQLRVVDTDDRMHIDPNTGEVLD